MDVISLLLLGTLCGNELAVSAFVHPAIRRLHDDQHAGAAQSIAATYGKYAPFWYIGTVIALVITIFVDSGKPGQGEVIGAAIALLVAILFTFVGPLPINNRIVRWDLSNLPRNWKVERARWDKLHGVRVAVLLISFLFLSIGVSLH